MACETIMPVARLQELREAGQDVLVLDCTFDLADPARGRAVFAEEHIPGARYVHLDEDLSGIATGTNGRHPLPDCDAFAASMRALGLRKGQQVVAYDGDGNVFAARAWWLLRWIGHREAAVLDGARPAWIAAGLPLESGVPAPAVPGDVEPQPPLVADPVAAADVLENIAMAEQVVLDARDPGRFRGESGPLDPVSGRIPGARNRFYRDNLTGEGTFRPAEELAADFVRCLGDRPASDAILQCGSGVSACHNALALEIAGMPGARLYPGSWSEWIADPARPVATGED